MTKNQPSLMLSGGPASEWIDRQRNIGPKARWTLAEPWTRPANEPVPEAVWLCRVEWGVGEWRVRDQPEPIRGRSALYRLERNPDNSPKQAVDGAYLYSHVPDDEIDQYVPGASAAARGPWGADGDPS